MLKKFDKDLLTRIGVALTIVLVSTAVILGAWRIKDDKPTPIEDPVAVYTQAVSHLTAAENIYYKVTGSKITAANDNTIEESFSQLITYEAQNSSSFRGCVEEDLTVGTQNIKSFEFFSEGIAYFTTQSASYKAEMAQADYTKRYTPVMPIDSALYAEISGVKTRAQSTITFSKPGSVESWVAAEGCSILDATASVIIDSNGELSESDYTVTYDKSGTIVTLQVKVTVIGEPTLPIQLPDTNAYTEISDISVPKLLERACGYLTATQNIYAEYADAIYCEAFGDERIQTSTLSACSAEDYTAMVDTTVSVSNSSKAGAVSTAAKYERFEKGVYSYSSDGSTYSIESSVDKAAMLDYVESLLIGTILLPEHIASVETIETENEIQYKIRPEEEFASILAQDACLMVYQNATVLIEQATDSKTINIASYLCINKQTGMPTASGFDYSGTYTIGGIPYKLTFKADQSYHSEPVVNDDSPDKETPPEENQTTVE